MTRDPFWLSDNQWELIEPLLPTRQRGPKRVSDRIVISGIVHVLRSGCAWRDVPREYGPYMTVFNRYHRWKQRGVWQRLAAALVADAPAAYSQQGARHSGQNHKSQAPKHDRDVAAQLDAVLCANEGQPKAKLMASLIEWHENALLSHGTRIAPRR